MKDQVSWFTEMKVLKKKKGVGRSLAIKLKLTKVLVFNKKEKESVS